MQGDVRVSKERRHHHWSMYWRSCCGETWRLAVMSCKDGEGVGGVWCSTLAVNVKQQDSEPSDFNISC